MRVEKSCLRYAFWLALPWLLGLAGCFVEAVRFRPPPEENPGLELPLKIKIIPKECSPEKNDRICRPITTRVSRWHAGQLEIILKGKKHNLAVESVKEMVVYGDSKIEALVGFSAGVLTGALLPWGILLFMGLMS
ncbi:MAG TPA: hypothetical protein VM425_04145 [Myxococcota bacterium]|nr:hypothetical protein [Myxococcota bacterium]